MKHTKIILLLLFFNTLLYCSDHISIYNIKIHWELILKWVLILLLIAFIIILIQRNHNKNLKNILNSAIEGIGIFEDEKLIEGNKPLLSLLGYRSINEIKGKTVFDFIDDKEHDYLKSKLLKPSLSYEVSMKRKDGTLFPALVRGTSISNTKRISTVIDLSQLKKMQHELQELNKNLEKKIKDEVLKSRKKDKILYHQSKLASMGEMLNNIAHQWRQPLTDINATVMAIDLKLMGDKYENKEVDNFLQNIELQTKYMSNTIDNFRDFFMPDKEKDDFLISKAVENALNIVGITLEKKGINISTNIIQDKLIHGYVGEYIQVIITILNNSKDALINSQKNPLNIDIIIDKNVSIEDNGGGIDKKILDRIFEPYFTTKHKNVGTGIGLYMAKMIIEDSMDGQLIASNTKKGAKFTINI